MLLEDDKNYWCLNFSGSSQDSMENSLGPHAGTSTGQDGCQTLRPSPRTLLLANGTDEHAGVGLQSARDCLEELKRMGDHGSNRNTSNFTATLANTLARCTEHNNRYRVSRNGGQDRLEVKLCNFSSNQQPLWSSRLFHPVPTLLQLAAKSVYSSNRCLSPAMKCNRCTESYKDGELNISTVPPTLAGLIKLIKGWVVGLIVGLYRHFFEHEL